MCPHEFFATLPETVGIVLCDLFSLSRMDISQKERMAGRTEGGPPSLPPSCACGERGGNYVYRFIGLSVSPLSLSFPVLILAGGGGGVGFVNLNSPLSLEGGNTQRMSFEFPDYSFSLLIADLCDLPK